NFFKKNFQKHLVSLEKVFTFALANRQTDDRNSMLIYAKRTKFIDIKYNNQVRKKNQSVNFKLS
ncbi:hypothetical protein, partial [Soonwooa purpurea]